MYYETLKMKPGIIMYLAVYVITISENYFRNCCIVETLN